MVEKEAIYIPYISVSRLDRVLELVKTRTMHKVDTDTFSTYGFNNTDAPLAVKLLRFLGAIDDEGNATSIMGQLQLQSDEKRKAAMAEIVRKSYERLFAAVNNPYTLTPKELIDDMRVHYNQSTRIAGSAVPVFLRLSEHAGLKDATTTVRKPYEKRTVREAAPKVQKGSGSQILTPATEEGVHTQPIVRGKMNISIPEDIFLRTATDDALNEAWRTVLKAAHKFAADHLKDETPNAEAPEAS